MTQKPVRFVYCVPSDVQPNSQYIAAINKAMQALQSWYFSQVGKPFSLYSPEVQTVFLLNSANYYVTDSWNRVQTDLGSYDFHAHFNDYIWVLYADVLHGCDEPGRLGVGTSGLCIMPRQDMEELCGAKYVDDCGKEWQTTINQAVGGCGHELGHAFGLPHPPGCGTEDESQCDWGALMYLGFHGFPDCYLTEADKAALRVHPSFLPVEVPSFPGYREIDFTMQNGLKVTFVMEVINGELTCEAFDRNGNVDFTANEKTRWLWDFIAMGGKIRPRSFDKI